MNDIKHINKIKSICNFLYRLNNDNYCEYISFYDQNYIFENTIRRHPLKEKIVKMVSELPYLKYVNLRKSRINNFPDFVSNSIEYLDISCNNFISVTEKNLNLPKLKYLNLGSNFLQKLPDLSNLPLEELKLHKNQIKELSGIPKTIKNLNLFINNLDEIPKIVFDLLNLEILSFGMTTMKQMPDFSMLNLKWLNLPCNQIKSIPKTLCSSKNLEGLILAKNQINKISNEIGDLEKLHTLSLYKNKIKSLPNSFYKLKLKKFCIQNNPINTVKQ